MNRILTTLLAIITVIFGSSQKASAQEQDTLAFRTVSVEEFEKIIADDNVIRLDVRSEEEYEKGHIEGTINIDVLKPTFKKTAIEKLDKKKVIALYCRSGKRSKTAAGMLAKSGFTVIELDGGFNAWMENKKPVAK